MIFETAPLALSPKARDQAGELLPQIVAAIRADLIREMGEARPIDDLMQHLVETEAGEFLVWPGDGGLYVDAVAWEDGPVLDEGPFKGKRMSLPRPASLAKGKPDAPA